MRIALVFMAPALVIGPLEAGLRVFDYGHPTSYWIKARNNKTYLSNPDFGLRFFSRALNRPVIAAAVSRAKPEDTYRIFVFGGSAAWGAPDEAYSFARILEAMLNERFTDIRFEVINTAMTAINSHVVYEIAKDCRQFEGDFYVVYMGNNEVVGPYGLGTALTNYKSSLWAIRMNAFVRTTRTGQLLSDVLGGTRGPKEWRGLEMFLENTVTSGDARLEGTYENFRDNLRDICHEANKTGAQVILSTVITNLKDLPPFASANRADTSPAEGKRWDTLFNEGAELQKSGDHTKALGRYEIAREIDDTSAELHFRMGRCFLALKTYNRARDHFIQARDLDTLRFRADTRINQTIRTVAEEFSSRDVHLVDAAAEVSGRGAPGGIHGTELLYEHVHLRFEGNYALAAEMYRKVVSLLPSSIRESSAAAADPPSPERCADLIVFTPHARWSNMERMLTLTGRAPFRAEHRARDAAALTSLKKQVTPDVLASVEEAYRERLTVRPDDLLLLRRFALFEASRGRNTSAAEQTALGLRVHPYDLPGPLINLGDVLRSQGRFQEAAEQYEEVLRRDPDNAMVRSKLESSLLGLKRLREAATQYERAVELKPDDPANHHNLADALQALERFGEAIAHYKEALRLKPDYDLAHNNFAWLLATCPDSKYRDARKAEASARRACELTGWKHFRALDTLGAACAARGKFDEAVKWQTKAVELAPEHARTDLQSRLELYAAGRPSRGSL